MMWYGNVGREKGQSADRETYENQKICQSSCVDVDRGIKPKQTKLYQGGVTRV